MAYILLADDDELISELVRNALAASGHVVGRVADGAEAVRVAELKQPDLIILDCSMPRLPGIEALRRIRQLPQGSRTPILMLTARTGEADREIAARAGANDYLGKPFSPTQLVVRVESLLEKAASGRLSPAWN